LGRLKRKEAKAPDGSAVNVSRLRAASCTCKNVHACVYVNVHDFAFTHVCVSGKNDAVLPLTRTFYEQMHCGKHVTRRARMVLGAPPPRFYVRTHVCKRVLKYTRTKFSNSATMQGRMARFQARCGGRQASATKLVQTTVRGRKTGANI
jgi:hypothetical protein